MPTSEEIAEFSITAYKGIDVGLGKEDPGVTRAAFAELKQEQLCDVENVPEAWLVPLIVSFDGVTKTSCPENLKKDVEGTVAWSVGFSCDSEPVIDKFGVTHHPKPLFTSSQLNAQYKHAVNVPEGWKLAPIEATDEMLDAAQNADDCMYRLDADRAYKAMINAVSQPAAKTVSAQDVKDGGTLYITTDEKKYAEIAAQKVKP